MGTRRSLIVLLAALGTANARAGELIVALGKSEGVTFVGALDRWDRDGAPRKPVDAKAKIDKPEVTARAERLAGNRWVFRQLPAGRYDLVILAGERVRVEGFHYPPVAEFDRFLPPSAKVSEEVRDVILKDIAASQHYENKVTPLYLGGDEKQVRVLMQLVRTSRRVMTASMAPRWRRPVMRSGSTPTAAGRGARKSGQRSWIAF